MNPNSCSVLLVAIGCLSIVACHSNTFSAPDLNDDPVLATAQYAAISEEAPTYGIALNGREFEVGTEAADGPFIRIGQDALVYVDSQRAPIPCTVTRKLSDASAETGQSLVWLKSLKPTDVASGEFVHAILNIKTKKDALIIPRSALFVRDGSLWAILASSAKPAAAPSDSGTEPYTPVQIKVGTMSRNFVEVIS